MPTSAPQRHLELLVEEPSAEAALLALVPMIAPAITFRVHSFEGKRDLLQKLPSRFRGYKRFLQPGWRLVVLADRDGHPCQELKARIEAMAEEAGLVSKRAATHRRDFQLVSRLAIEELEAWFLGDMGALRAAYERVPEGLERKARFRDPDAVAGGTWEALERILQQAGYYPTGMPKIEVARRVSRHMDPKRNRSHSFQVFRHGLLAAAG